jgi:hypothetical protein
MHPTHPLSPLTRASRALTALLTVWCLGCSAFDPIIAHLAGLKAGMICGADEIGTGGVVSTGDGNETATVGPVDEDGEGPVVCDCQSCAAPAPALVADAAEPSPAPGTEAADRVTPPGLDREPLVPPPQRVA